MSKYAATTSVSAEKTRGEIERTLTKYGADRYVYARDGSRAMVCFSLSGRSVKLELAMPDKDAAKFRRTPGGRRSRSADAAYKAWEQATRQRWRALLLVIKAKLEAVEAGIATFEDEFLAYMVVGNGQTIGQIITPQLDEISRRGKLPLLLPAPSGKEGRDGD